MKLSVLIGALGGRSLDAALDFLAQRGVQAVEVGCGGYPGKEFCDPEKLLSDRAALRDFRAAFQDRGLEIAALSCHGNPVHPDRDLAQRFHREFENAVYLAQELGVNTVVGFSGCPGGCPEDRTPNWAVLAWPDEYANALKYQWEDVLIPYWTKTAAFAKEHGVDKIALELHQGFSVYNPATLLRLRMAAGEVIGANLDPSHLFWQGMDPCVAAETLGSAIHFFHAKDTALNARNIARNGVLDPTPFYEPQDRAWIFRTVGYGHDAGTWKALMSALVLSGYDGAISIEHEDGLMTGEEGLEKAISFLREVMIFEKAR